MFFEGFGEPGLIEVEGAPVRLRRAGCGPAVLLLHGHPQTHAMWHAVAPLLARSFDVICPDLPGYGGTRPSASSNLPAGGREAMAGRMLTLLDALGLGAVSVIGHDRGGRVAHRMATGWPERVDKLALLDCVPPPEPVESEDMAFALATYRAFWFAQTHPKPEALFHDEPKGWMPGSLPGGEEDAHFHPSATADYLAFLPDTDSVAALNQSYREAVERDAAEDRSMRAGTLPVACPMLVMWGSVGRIGGWYDPVEIWQQRASGTVLGQGIEAGHFLAEEQPEAVASALMGFLSDPN